MVAFTLIIISTIVDIITGTTAITLPLLIQGRVTLEVWLMSIVSGSHNPLSLVATLSHPFSFLLDSSGSYSCVLALFVGPTRPAHFFTRGLTVGPRRGE